MAAFLHVPRCRWGERQQGGRRYCHYRCVAAAKSAASVCPVKNVSAETIERLVLGQLGVAIKSPEFVRLAAEEGGWSPDDVMSAVADVPAFIEGLVPMERARLVHCLVDEVVVRDDGVDIVFRKDAVKETGHANDGKTA